MNSTSSRTRHFRFLVVDDEEPVRRFLQKATQSRGHSCDVAPGTDAALELIRQHTYDVVVTDLRMPGRNGHSLCVDLLRQKDHPEILVATGVAEPRLAADLHTRGISTILYKPIDLNEFLPKLEALAWRRALASESTGQSDARNAGSGILEHPTPDSIDSNPESETTTRSPRLSPEQSDQADSSHPATRTAHNHIAFVLLNTPEHSEKIAEHIESDDISSRACQSADELLRCLKENRADVVVIQQEQNGFLSGVEIIERLYQQLIPCESLLLIDEDEKEARHHADSLGVAEILDSAATGEEIAAAIRRLLQEMAEDDNFIPLHARRFIRRCPDLPTLPQLLIRLLGYLQMDLSNIPIDELTADISTDPRATADLLRVTNSSSLGLRNEVRRVSDAIALLGPKRSISLVFSSALSSTRNTRLPEPVSDWYYQRCALTAATAEIFAERMETISGDLAFVFGMLQDIGMLTLASQVRRYSAHVKRVRTTAISTMEALEKDDFGMTHAEVGAALLNEWGLPRSFVRPVLKHHEPHGQKMSHLDAALHRVMQIAEAFANLRDVPDPRRRSRLNQLLNHYGPSKSKTCHTALEEAVAHARESSRVLSLPVPDTDTLMTLISDLDESPQE